MSILEREDYDRDMLEQQAVCEEADKKPAKLPIPRYQPWPEGVKKLSELPPLSEEEQAVRMGYFRKIVEEKAFQPVHWIDAKGKKRRQLVDLFTAGMVCSTIDSCKPELRATILHLEPMRLIEVLWKASK